MNQKLIFILLLLIALIISCDKFPAVEEDKDPPVEEPEDECFCLNGYINGVSQHYEAGNNFDSYSVQADSVNLGLGTEFILQGNGDTQTVIRFDLFKSLPTSILNDELSYNNIEALKEHFFVGEHQVIKFANQQPGVVLNYLKRWNDGEDNYTWEIPDLQTIETSFTITEITSDTAEYIEGQMQRLLIRGTFNAVFVLAAKQTDTIFADSCKFYVDRPFEYIDDK